jgi:hypothetical protein
MACQLDVRPFEANFTPLAAKLPVAEADAAGGWTITRPGEPLPATPELIGPVLAGPAFGDPVPAADGEKL